MTRRICSACCKNIADNINIREENSTLRRRLAEVGELGPLFGRSLPMRKVITAIERLAQSSASVVITGESGTGKELVARTIHELSPRRDAAYVPVNCAAIPETLMESELFGHERGSFTGADRRKEGCFEVANGGTLLLDELTEMKAELQPKLLRVIEEQRLRRVGGTAEIPLDVRVLASSNRDIEQAVREGKLRSDLFYRLNVFTIVLPPLRERIDDLPQLTQMFVNHYAAQNKKDVTGVDEECMKALQAHPWPGNVRQLRNVIERALIVCEGRTIRKTGPARRFSRGGWRGRRRLHQDTAGHFARRRRERDDHAHHRVHRRQQDPRRRDSWSQRQNLCTTSSNASAPIARSSKRIERKSVEVRLHVHSREETMHLRARLALMALLLMLVPTIVLSIISIDSRIATMIDDMSRSTDFMIAQIFEEVRLALSQGNGDVATALRGSEPVRKLLDSTVAFGPGSGGRVDRRE